VWETLTWKDVRVGDFVRVLSNEIIPADILLLHTSDPDGVCHMETANLDGETSLKQRKVVPGFSALVRAQSITQYLGPRYKRSKIERKMNTDVLFCVVLLFFMCLIGSQRLRLQMFIWLLTLIFPGLSLQVMIPVSLYVSIELVKMWQIFFITQDVELYDEELDSRVQCRALNITEDLGQIQYVFSDKTGTLTENKMVFRRCSIIGTEYCHEENGVVGEFVSETVVVPDRKLMLEVDRQMASIQTGPYLDFFLALAICNTVSPSGSEEVCYEAHSPDEAALIHAAKAYGFSMVERTPHYVTVKLPNEALLKFEVLDILTFDSTRRRMSIIVRHPHTKEITMYTKGADSAVMERLGNKQIAVKTQKDLDMYARNGLRTLCFAKKVDVISEQEFRAWSAVRQEALSAMDEKEERLMETANFIESNFTLLGATGIEDRLQESVPETIQALRRAGMQIWVLTGDKPETAINIAYSCKLLEHEDLVFTFTFTGPLMEPSIGLVIDGLTLSMAMSDELVEQFVELCKHCRAVLCCRVTPLQKMHWFSVSIHYDLCRCR
uniref:P-type phospholipid transporter n=1 Tax=Sinocyclocheilus grahami TaxID=75366 RepID=A0A672SME2_SINGR